MKQSQPIPKTTLCQSGCLVLIRILLTQVATFQAILSFIPAGQLIAVCVYITGLITCTDISATGISCALALVSHDTLTRMLSNPGWVSHQFMQASIKLVALMRGKGWLIIDDTLIPKPFAKLIAFCGWDFDHAQNRNVFGIRLVFIVWSNGWISVPLLFYIWQKDPEKTPKKKKTKKGHRKGGRKKKRGPKIASNTPQARYQRKRRQELKKAAKNKRPRTATGAHYRTKNELARILVWQVIRAGVEVDFILLDNWYASQKNLRFFRRMGLKWVTRLKSNTVVFFQGKKLTIAKLAKKIPALSCHRYAKLGARVRSFDVNLHGCPIKLTVVKNDTHEESGRTKFIATNDRSLTNFETVIWYRRRWPIEVFFRDIKVYVNLSKAQVQISQAVLAHIVLACAAYVVLQLLKPLSSSPHLSINQSKKALCSLRLLLDFCQGTATLVWLKPRGRFEVVDFEHLLKPLKTRVSEIQIPETVELTEVFATQNELA